MCIPQNIEELLSNYELVMSEAADAGVDITTQNFTISWDFIQAIFFSTTILTTIGNKLGMETPMKEGN